MIAYYNRFQYVRESIESAMAQTYPNVELIVIDDGSTEAAYQELMKIPGPRVVRQPNGGVANARNRGLREANGEFVVFLDDDDHLLPGAIASHVEALQAQPDAGLVFSGIREIDETGRVTGGSYLCAPRRNYFLSMLESNPIHCPAAAMLRREAVLAFGGFDATIAPSEDYEMYVKLAHAYPVVRHAGTVAEYRIHGNNVSNDRGKMIRATARALDKLERTLPLTAAQRKRIQLARRRSKLIFNDHKTPWQKVQLLGYRLRSLAQSSPVQMWRERRTARA